MRLSVRDLGKRFGAQAALDGVSLDFHAGEVHAVLGENGAGKSTLMNAIYGLVRLDRGSVRVDDREVRFRSAADARRAGIGMVHQEFALVDALSVTENLALAVGDASAWRLDRHAIEARARRLADESGLEIGDFSAAAGGLPVGVRQRVEILKALATEARVLILDEPTAVLTPAETAQLFRVLDRVRARGAAVLFVTHKLREVMEIADRVTVLRRGRVAATAPRAEVDEARLVERMIGEAAPVSVRRCGTRAGAWPRLRVRGLTRRGSGGVPRLDRVCVEIAGGEIFGVAGVDGNGQSELFEALAGLRAADEGTVEVDGQPVRATHPAGAIAAGIGCIPPERKRLGLISEMSVQENLALHRGRLRALSRGGFLDPARMRSSAAELVDRFVIRTDGVDAPVSSLSGGNQQRLVVARALSLAPPVLVVFNPTRGLDIAATRAVHAALAAQADRGAAVLLLSTDLDEVLGVSDRMAVLYRGRMSGALRPPFDAEQVGVLMAGGTAPGEG